jgi:hypothetical protein
MMARMSEHETGSRIPSDDQVAVELLLAVRAGDIEVIQRLLRNDPALTSIRLVQVMRRRCTTRPAATMSTWPKL